jgi:uncharacterized protein
MTTSAGVVSSTSSMPPGDPSPRQSVARRIFIGPNGIRAGWRVLIFLALFAAIGRMISLLAIHTPGLREFIQAYSGLPMKPQGQILGLYTPLVLILSAWIMTRIEKRSFADYGLPLSEAFRKRFWQGVPLGFAMLCVLLGLIAAFHGFSLSGEAVTGVDAIEDAALYAFGFICVGFFEEFSFRGYLQSALSSGMGFWPAAILLSVIFGAIHLGNPGEAWIGGLMAGSFGFLSCFALWRTGNIWLSIGMHASWDWGETCFFGTPDSGLVAQGHILNSSFHGPTWLTGGSVGPEGSWLVFLVLLVWALAIYLLFSTRRVPAQRST